MKAPHKKGDRVIIVSSPYHHDAAEKPQKFLYVGRQKIELPTPATVLSTREYGLHLGFEIRVRIDHTSEDRFFSDGQVRGMTAVEMIAELDT